MIKHFKKIISIFLIITILPIYSFSDDINEENLDKNKPGDPTGLPVPVIVVVKFRGSVSAVRSAMEAAAEAARKVSDVISEHIIPSPTEDTEKMLKISGFDKT